MVSSMPSKRSTGFPRSLARTLWSAPIYRDRGRRPGRLFLRALRLRLGAQLHQLLQPRAREDVRAAVDRARPGKAQDIGLGARPPAAGRRRTADHLQLPPWHLPLPAGTRNHGDDEQPVQRLALRERLPRAIAPAPASESVFLKSDMQ